MPVIHTHAGQVKPLSFPRSDYNKNALDDNVQYSKITLYVMWRMVATFFSVTIWTQNVGRLILCIFDRNG